MEVLHKRWIVRDSERFTIAEVDARSVPGARGSCCLICESDLSVRRLWSYPADWNRMEDARVLALFAAPVVRNTPVKTIGLEAALQR